MSKYVKFYLFVLLSNFVNFADINIYLASHTL